MIKFAAVTLLFIMACPSGEILGADTGNITVIPRPQEIVRRDGGFFLNIGTPVIVTGETRGAGEYLCSLLGRASGIDLEVMEAEFGIREAGSIILKTDPGLGNLGPEGYVLKIDGNGVLISAYATAGVFYGIQTLRQMLPSSVESGRVQHAGWLLPHVEINDRPRFGWRGLMIDCSRTFQSVDYLKRMIDLLALYKLNVLHLHLTDDQGWRVEIKRYPELAGKGSRFPARYGKPGGCYSQDELKELVRYAGARQVRLVPEIEIPGHCLAALACYPELSCTGGPFEIYPFFMGPGIQENVFCAGSDKVFEFIENVLSEVVRVFPGRYVHIGGDEVPKTMWKECDKCRDRMRKMGLRSEDELQSYFIRRIERFLESKGRCLIGWDEIIEGGLAPGAAVMSWRGMKGGIHAAIEGHDVVMSPTSHCYLDYSHETTSVEKSYSFDPVPAGIPVEKRKHILGLQGCMWTHIATNDPAVDRQVFPRLIALAEVAWTEPELRSREDFFRRLKAHYPRLDELAVMYYKEIGY
ncbi:MAG: beta-N-acetylhexosaminidase [Gemmatimonadota bacterium]|nr:beta-N-acetylhexosaminidase [Gemmatimonadota bacterium]